MGLRDWKVETSLEFKVRAKFFFYMYIPSIKYVQIRNIHIVVQLWELITIIRRTVPTDGSNRSKSNKELWPWSVWFTHITRHTLELVKTNPKLVKLTKNRSEPVWSFSCFFYFYFLGYDSMQKDDAPKCWRSNFFGFRVEVTNLPDQYLGQSQA